MFEQDGMFYFFLHTPANIPDWVWMVMLFCTLVALYEIGSLLLDWIIAAVNAISFTYCVTKSGIERAIIDPENYDRPDTTFKSLFIVCWTTFKLFATADKLTVESEFFSWTHAFNFTTYSKFIKK